MIKNLFVIVFLTIFATSCSTIGVSKDDFVKTTTTASGGYLGYKLTDGDIFTTTVGSTIGAVLGSYLIDFLNKDDYYFYKTETIKVLGINDNNKTINTGYWKNPRSGNEGVISIKGHYGIPECRLIEHTFILDSKSYIFACKLKPDLNKYVSFIHLYQRNLLQNHIKKYSENNIISNTRYPFEEFNTYNLVEKSFLLLSSELFELFKRVWDINDTSHKDSNLYNFLPTEYKVLLYRIKGLYFQNRQDNKISEKNEYLQENDIFQYLKKIELDLLLKVFFIRRKMKNILENKNIPTNINNSFRDISVNMDKMGLKMIAILTNHLYPEVKRTEV